MDSSNTPVCEQTFSWLNKFRNLKTMNEAHFKLFILYVIDLHNLHIEKKVDLLANPLNPKRWEIITKKSDEEALEAFGKLSLEEASTSNEKILTDIAETAMVDCYKILSNGDFSCNFCPGFFKKVGNIRNHLNTKHQMSLELKCGCGKTFDESKKLNRHQKSCKK